MKRVGLKKEREHLSNLSVNEVSLIEVPKMGCFMILDDKRSQYARFVGEPAKRGEATALEGCPEGITRPWAMLLPPCV